MEQGSNIASKARCASDTYTQHRDEREKRMTVKSGGQMEENFTRMESDEIEIDLGELLYYLLGKIWYVLIAAAALGALSLALTFFLIKPTYKSTTQMYVLNRQNTDTLTQSDLQSSSTLTNDYVVLIQSRTVLEKVIADMGLDMTYEALQEELSVSAVRDTRIISISVTDHDPYQARELANAIREEAGERIKTVMNIEAVNVVEEANIPTHKAGPSLKKSLLIGVLLGAFAVLAYFTLMFILDDKVNDAEDVEKLRERPLQSLVVSQVYNRQIASDTKLALMELYGDEYEGLYIHNLALPDQSLRKIPLYELDRQEDIDHLTTFFVPKAPFFLEKP